MWYVYAHYIKSKVFYIGIGVTKDRYKITRNRPPEWYNRVKLNKNRFSYLVLHTGLQKAQACELEKYYILKYGRVDLGTGVLTNRTAGAQGNTQPSLETRKRIGDAQRNKIVSEETRLKQSLAAQGRIAWNKGKPMTEAAKKHLSKINTGKKLSAETIEKLRVTSTGKTHTKKARLKIALALQGNKNGVGAKHNHVGVNNPFFGKKHSRKTKLKMKNAKLLNK